MFFRQYQLPCLSLFSYMVGDTTTGRAVVVDPQRDIDQYLSDAAEAGLAIERVVETHFHADFVSGHLELAAATGADISYGEAAHPEFPFVPLADGSTLSLGEVLIEARATPGHTPESVSLVVWEHASDPGPWCVLTGDTLFIGDVGRPDLLAAAGHSSEEMARQLYRSLHGRLLTLPDTTRVYPAHGAGSACGRQMSSASDSTIGEQRRLNYALKPMTEDEFVALVTADQPAAPPYFPFAAGANRQRHELLGDRSEPGALTLDEAMDRRAEGAVLLDCRAPEVFASGHVRGSINVGLDGRFAEYAGDVMGPDQPVVVIADPGREQEARVRLARIGFDRVVGFLPEVEARLSEHPELAETATRLPAGDVASWREDGGDLQILDVRNPGEWEDGVVPGAVLVPLARLAGRIGDMDAGRGTVVYCASGYRSSVAASYLRAHGFARVADVPGGAQALADAGVPMEAPARAPGP